MEKNNYWNKSIQGSKAGNKAYTDRMSEKTKKAVEAIARAQKASAK